MTSWPNIKLEYNSNNSQRIYVASNVIKQKCTSNLIRSLLRGALVCLFHAKTSYREIEAPTTSRHDDSIYEETLSFNFTFVTGEMGFSYVRALAKQYFCASV